MSWDGADLVSYRVTLPLTCIEVARVPPAVKGSIELLGIETCGSNLDQAKAQNSQPLRNPG